MLELYWAYQDRDGLMKFVENIFKELLSGIGKGNTISYQGKKINFKTPWKRIKYSEIDFEKDKEKLIQPTFVVDHPLEITPLAKAKDDNKKYADRFQLVAGGIELINGFSELNNPLEQRERLSKNNKRKDEDFLQALEYGMPPAAGFGIGIDRLSALLTDSHSLREIILFPTMRPKKK
jgi:lysyl-tRNA synthetase class 2